MKYNYTRLKPYRTCDGKIVSPWTTLKIRRFTVGHFTFCQRYRRRGVFPKIRAIVLRGSQGSSHGNDFREVKKEKKIRSKHTVVLTSWIHTHTHLCARYTVDYLRSHIISSLSPTSGNESCCTTGSDQITFFS